MFKVRLEHTGSGDSSQKGIAMGGLITWHTWQVGMWVYDSRGAAPWLCVCVASGPAALLQGTLVSPFRPYAVQ